MNARPCFWQGRSHGPLQKAFPPESHNRLPFPLKSIPPFAVVAGAGTALVEWWADMGKWA